VTNLRLVPDFSLEIGGGPIPAALRGSITSLTHVTGLGAADRVEVHLANEKLRWLDDPLLAIGNELRLSIGYRPDPLVQVFVGEIVSHEATFPSSGLPSLTVAAQDALVRLQQGRRDRSFAIPIPTYGNTPLPDPVVAGIVSLEKRLVPVFEPVGAALSVVLAGADAIAAGGPDGMQKVIRKQEGETDFDFLTRIASENGWELHVDHSGATGGYRLRFFSALDHVTPDVELRYGHSLIDFTPRVSTVGQIASVTAHVWISEIKMELSVTVGWDWDRSQLTIDVSAGGQTEREGPSDVIVDEPVTPASAPRAIVSQLIPKLNQRLTGTGTVVGDPRLQAGAVTRLEGLGVSFGGLYRVTSATHTMDGSGYRTRFDARKEIWFGSIPLPDQGAVPVRVL
jgi:hypothetical protein